MFKHVKKLGRNKKRENVYYIYELLTARATVNSKMLPSAFGLKATFLRTYITAKICNDKLNTSHYLYTIVQLVFHLHKGIKNVKTFIISMVPSAHKPFVSTTLGIVSK